MLNHLVLGFNGPFFGPSCVTYCTHPDNIILKLRYSSLGLRNRFIQKRGVIESYALINKYDYLLRNTITLLSTEKVYLTLRTLENILRTHTTNARGNCLKGISEY